MSYPVWKAFFLEFIILVDTILGVLLVGSYSTLTFGVSIRTITRRLKV